MERRYRQLGIDERTEIYRLHADGKSLRIIAKAIGRAPSTVSRELRRNSGDSVGYKVSWAMIQSRARRKRKLYKLERSSRLREMVFNLLAMEWSPEQIAARLEQEHGRPLISHESIYRYIYRRVNSHKENLHRCLPRAKYKRGWRGRRGGSSARYIKDRVSIHDRPQVIGDRRQSGHWETDFMLFSQYGQAALVTVERTSRFLLAAKQPDKTARAAADSLTALMKPLKRDKKRSMTFDNGSEFSEHGRLKRECRMQTFFCDTHSPWQKGSVENAIGRLRRNLPRKTDLKTISQEDIDDIILTYNMTPRKCLGFKTPAEVFFNNYNRCCT